MRKFFKKQGLIVLAVAVVITLIMVLTNAFSGGRASIVTNIVGVVVSPVEKGLTGILGWFGSVYDYMFEYDALKAENEQLKEQIADLEEQVRQGQSAIEENTYLRDLLNLSEKRTDFQFVEATIVSWGTSNWTSTFTINKGSMQGVEAKDCVVTATGELVGVVTSVGANWATVSTVMDPGVEIGALVLRTNEAAIAEGDFDLMNNGRLRLSYISGDSELINGDTVMTSGAGGIYPSGLVIGVIEEVGIDATGLSKYAIIEPAADTRNLTEIFVIKSYAEVG